MSVVEGVNDHEHIDSHAVVISMLCCFDSADFDSTVFPQAMGLDALHTSHPIEVEVIRMDKQVALHRGSDRRDVDAASDCTAE